MGCSRARRSIGSILSAVNAHVSRCARTTVLSMRCSSSSSAARAFSVHLVFVLCCIAARMRAFSRLGTRPNLTAETDEKRKVRLLIKEEQFEEEHRKRERQRREGKGQSHFPMKKYKSNQQVLRTSPS